MSRRSQGISLAYFGVPHIGGPYSVYRSLRAGLAAHGFEIRWLGVGAAAMAVMRDRQWACEHANGEALAVENEEDQNAARQVIEHLEQEGYEGVLIGALCGRLATNMMRYLPPRFLRLLLVHTTSPGVYRAARTVRDHAHATIAVSPRIRDDLVRKFGFDAAHTHAVPNTLELEPYTRIVRAQEEQAPLRVLFLGRLEDESKGIFWLPRILAALDNADVRFTIAGDGPDREELQRRCAKLGIRIGVLGRVAPDQVPQLLASQDVLIMPSRYEGFGYTIIEAMAGGCVPVASRIRGVTDAIVRHGGDGLLFPIGDTRAAADAIRGLARDRGLLARMSETARSSVAGRFSSEAMAAQYAAILRSVRDAPPAIAPPLPLERWSYPMGLRPGLRTYLPTGVKNVLRLWRERLA